MVKKRVDFQTIIVQIFRLIITAISGDVHRRRIMRPNDTTKPPSSALDEILRVNSSLNGYDEVAK